MTTLIVFAIVIILAFTLLRKSAMLPKDAVLDAKQAQDWIKSEKSIQVLDVRTPGEFSQGHLAGAKLIPVGELEARIGELDNQKPVLVYCASGGRSTVAVGLLRRNGFASSKHICGGIAYWQDAGLPVV